MLDLTRQNSWREQYRAQHPNWQPATERYASWVRKSLTPESRLLDLGCGRGGLVEQLGHPLGRIVGVDPDFDSLHEHRLALPRAQALGQLPFADQSFDLVFASWVLEHWENPLQELQEIGRVLRPNGRFIFLTPHRNHPIIWLNRALAQFSQLQTWLVAQLYGRSAEDTFRLCYRGNWADDLSHLAEKAGLRLAELAFIEDPTYLAFTPQLFRLMCAWEKLISAESKLHLVGILQKS